MAATQKQKAATNEDDAILEAVLDDLHEDDEEASGTPMDSGTPGSLDVNPIDIDAKRSDTRPVQPQTAGAEQKRLHSRPIFQVPSTRADVHSCAAPPNPSRPLHEC